MSIERDYGGEMNDFSPCCMKRIGELERQALEETRVAYAKGLLCEITLSGYCRTCGMALTFNHVHWMYQGELDLGPVPTEVYVYTDQDSVVKPD